MPCLRTASISSKRFSVSTIFSTQNSHNLSNKASIKLQLLEAHLNLHLPLAFISTIDHMTIRMQHRAMMMMRMTGLDQEEKCEYKRKKN